MNASESNNILVERDGAVGWIRINRPERLNAFAGTMREEIEAGLLALERDDHIRCVVITGIGRAFSTGGDIRVMAGLAEEGDAERFDALVRAAELIFTGGMINAERAERMGIFNRVVPGAELEPAARDLANQIAAGPAQLIAAIKGSLRQSLNSSLDEMLEREIGAQAEAFASPDFQEGIKAFLEKRAPRFGR